MRQFRRSARRQITLAPIVALLVAMMAAPSLGVAQVVPPVAPPAATVTEPPFSSNLLTGPAVENHDESANGTSKLASDGPVRKSPPAARRTDLPHDLSPWGMFMAADRVVKAVMIGLAFASLVTWTVLLAKSIEVTCARARARKAYAVITSSGSLAAADGMLVNRGGPAAFMVRSAGDEMRQSFVVLDYAGEGGVKERVMSRLARIEAQAGRRLTRGTGLLATIGATAPFVGLFGTVWGIMNSFIGISQAQTTNLAVVAPGIAEALLATALGLVAAIPAVIIYNVFARAIIGYRQLLADAAAGVERLISRDLDFRRVPQGAGLPAMAAE